MRQLLAHITSKFAYNKFSYRSTSMFTKTLIVDSLYFTSLKVRHLQNQTTCEQHRSCTYYAVFGSFESDFSFVSSSSYPDRFLLSCCLLFPQKIEEAISSKSESITPSLIGWPIQHIVHPNRCDDTNMSRRCRHKSNKWATFQFPKFVEVLQPPISETDRRKTHTASS